MIERLLTRAEKGFWGERTWAMETMTFRQRLLFYRDTGCWPGACSKALAGMLLEEDIAQERAKGKIFCAEQKSARAKMAGLKVE